MLQGIERFWPSADSNSQDKKSVFYREDIFSDNDLPFDFDLKAIIKKVLAIFFSYMYLNVLAYLIVDILISLVKRII